MTDRCDAHAGDRGDGYPAAHTCDDPLLCALGSLVDGPTEVEQLQKQVTKLHGLIQDRDAQLHEVCTDLQDAAARIDSLNRLLQEREAVLKLIHDERSDPR